jgi:hypothetical protein
MESGQTSVEGLSGFHKKALNEVPTSKFCTAIISPNKTSILDRNSISGREAIMFLGAVAVEMDEDVEASLVSRTTLERHRKKRSEITSSIKEEVAQWGRCAISSALGWEDVGE